MSSGQKTTQDSTSETKPYSPAIPALQEILDDSMSSYRTGVGSQVYQGPRYAGLGDTTSAGLLSLKDSAAPLSTAANTAAGAVNGLVANGGQTAGGQAGLGIVNSTLPGYQGLLSGLSGPSQTQRSLQDTADGKFLGGANPYLDDLISRGASDASNSVAARFSAGGRYGSGAMGGAVAKAAGDISTSTRAADYDAERARQASAASAIDSAGLARTSAGAGLLGAIGGVGTTNISAAQGDRAALLSGVSALPTVQAGLLAPSEALIKAGSLEDASRQDAINAEREKFADQQSQQWNQLGLYSSLVDPIAGMGGSSTGHSVTEQSGPSLFQSLLGGLSAGAGILGKISDERAKEDIQEVGTLHDGQPIYSYRYKGSEVPEIGLLAQNVMSDAPDAVGTTPSGLLAVDYGRATARAARMAPSNRKAA